MVTKIVYLLEDLKRGGVQIGALLQAPQLNRSEFQPEIWALKAKSEQGELEEEFRLTGLPLRYFNIRDFKDRKGILELAQALQTERIAVLNAKSFFPNMVGRIAAQLARTPVIIANYHNTYEHKWEPKLVRLDKALQERTDLFLCVSEDVRVYLSLHLGLPRQKAIVLPNGFDIPRFQISKPKEQIRQELGLPIDAPIIGMVGRLTAVKRTEDFIRGAIHIAQRSPKAFFLIVGDGEERNRLERLANEVGLADQVCFTGSRGDVPDLLNAMDCMVLPSLAEGFGRVIVEAFAAGTPVVATPSAGVKTIVQDGLNGLLIPFSNPQALADAVMQTIADPGKTRARIDQARLDVQEYDLPNWVKRMEKLLRNLIDDHQQAILDYQNQPLRSHNRLLLDYLLFRLDYHLRAVISKQAQRT